MDENKLMEYFLNAKDIGKIPEPTTVGIGGDPGCTDYIKLYLIINENDIIEEAKAEVFGCHVAIAATSAFIQMIKGKNFRDAINVKPSDVLTELGGLPEEKVHCCTLGPIALENAINDFLLTKLCKAEG
jgi:NifU-like protein involved in Fe-S cluster formation